jgi:hypothetical protein
MTTKGLRQKCHDRLLALKKLREDYDEEYYEIARFMATHRSRFLHGTERGATGQNNKTNRNQRRNWNGKLADTYGVKAFRTLTHGMTSGLTSASRPWFTLKTYDEDLMEEGDVRDWLSEVERRMYGFLAGTNFYGAAKSGYAELGLFGTEACIAMEHREKGMVCHSLTAGEYWIACGDAREPDVLYRSCPLTVREAMQMFGNAVSPRVRQLYDQSSYTDLVNYFHAIEPNSDYAGEFGQFPWRSVYWDEDDQREQVTKQSGFMEQPFWAPRWDVASGETYGASPGMDALPAVRELQMQARRRNQMIDQLQNPEKIVPASVRLTGQAGRVVTGNGITKDNVVVPYVPDWQALQAVREERIKLETEIDALSYAELFNAITNMQGIQPRTVEEIAARNEEKLTQLGPVIERVSTEKLEIAINRTYGIMLRGGMLPPVPEAMSERPIKIEFVSILTQMQRMVGIGQIERTAAFIGNNAALYPEAADKLDVDELIDEYADRAGAPPKIIRSAKEVEKIRAGRAQQQQMQQMAEMAPAMKDGAEAARLLSEADLTGQRTELPSNIPV